MELLIFSLLFMLAFAAPAAISSPKLLNKRSGDDVALSTVNSNIMINHGNCSLGAPSDCISNITAAIFQHYFDEFSGGGSIAHSAGDYAGHFHWKATFQGPATYAAFDKSQARLSKVTGVITDFVGRNNSAWTCVDFGNDEGLLNSGLLVFRWDGQPVVLDEKEVESRLTYDCQYGDMLMYAENFLQVEL